MKKKTCRIFPHVRFLKYDVSPRLLHIIKFLVYDLDRDWLVCYQLVISYVFMFTHLSITKMYDFYRSQKHVETASTPLYLLNKSLLILLRE